MMNSNNLSTQPSTPKSVWLAILLSVVGFADSFYLTLQHYQNKIPPCSVGSCETVLTSGYATIGPIPISLIGLGYYLVILLCLLALMTTGHQRWLKFFRIIVTLGFLVTLGLIGIQFFILHAICIYCMVSAGTTILLFIVSRMIKHD